MSTHRPQPTARAAALPSRDSTPPPAASIAVVTADQALVAQLRAAAPERDIATAATVATLADLLLSGRCGVLLIDIAALGAKSAEVVAHVAKQFPEVPLLGVGTRADESRLGTTGAPGALHRFLHKPFSEGRIRAFLEIALRDHAERRAARPAALAVPREQLPAHLAPPPPPGTSDPGVYPDAPAPKPKPKARATVEVDEPVPVTPGWQHLPTVILGTGVVVAAVVTAVALGHHGDAAATEAAPVAAALAPSGHGAARAPARRAGAAAEYPDAARAAGTEGWVEVRFRIERDGTTSEPSVLDAEPRGVFEESAVAAVGGWRYPPRPAPLIVEERIPYRLPH